MKLTMMAHLWFPRFREMLSSWFDFGVDLTGLGFDEEDLEIDLAAGRE